MEQLTLSQLAFLKNITFIGVIFIFMNVLTPLLVDWLKGKINKTEKDRQTSEALVGAQTIVVTNELLAKYINAYEHDVKSRLEMIRTMNAHLDEEKKQTPMLEQIHTKVVMNG